MTAAISVVADLCVTQYVCMHAVPEKGGVYLILQGSVEKLSQDGTSGKIISTQVRVYSVCYQCNTQHLPVYLYAFIQLHPGDTFGKMEEHFVTKSR